MPYGLVLGVRRRHALEAGEIAAFAAHLEPHHASRQLHVHTLDGLIGITNQALLVTLTRQGERPSRVA